MTFYEKFLDECDKKHVRPSKVIDEIGVSRNTYYTWKNKGVAPKLVIINRIADYFGVDIKEFERARRETILLRQT